MANDAQNLQNQIVADMEKAQRHEAEVKNLKDTISRLSREVQEYIKVENILVACGKVDKTDMERAHELVQSFSE